jgi:6-phosphogluconolactonase/glucosamine-6-phosphate isomerase/deaminase
MKIVVAADAPAAADVAAAWVAVRLRNAVARRGEASAAFSGGSTPTLMLAALTELDVPWRATTVFQVDERVAPDGDPDRNAALLDVLRHLPVTVWLMPVTVADLGGSARRYAARLPDRLDVVHLGLGDDGHTASWPPGDPVIDDPRAVALSGEFKGRVRMTLTPGVVNAARQRLVLATGASKAEVVQRWLQRDLSLPITRVRRTNTTLIVDTAAGAARTTSP